MKVRCALLLLLAASVDAAEIDPGRLAGLWTARREFGPALRGTLLIARQDKALVAHIAGRTAPASIADGQLSFTLPDGEGSFQGRVRGERVTGHWVQARAASFGFAFATPVTLTRNAQGQWTGAVTPVEDHMTFYLPVTLTTDGALTAFLRNPERNVGVYMDVQRLLLDGTRVQLINSKNAVRAEGTYDPGDDRISLFIGSSGGTFDFHRAGPAEEAAFYGRGRNAPPYAYRKPIAMDDGWPVANVEDVAISREAIAKFIDMLVKTPIDSVHASDVHAFLVARHGKLVVEEYFHGTNPDELHDTRSAAKVITSILAAGANIAATTPVYAAMYGAAAARDIDPRKRAILVEHLQTMSSGLDCDDADPESPGREDTMQEQEAQPDWYRYTLDLKMIRNPGDKAVYCSCNPHLLGGVISRTTGQTLPDLFRELVAEPLQIRRYGMPLTSTRDAYMGGGIRFTPRDFMKLGQMMLDGGRWNGRQIVPAPWTKRATSPLFEMSGMKYGYLWWVHDLPYGTGTARVFFAGGNGGQIVMVIPELDAVIAFYGGNYSSRASRIPQNEFVPKYVLPAIK